LIAYFGTGLLGAGFVRRLLERGETVHVWNRTTEKAGPLEADGAKVFDDPREAVRGAAQIHLTLSDDASIDAVLEPLADVIPAAAIIADHTTTAPTPTGERVARWTQRGRTFVHAPVFMGPANAREGTGLMLLSGAPQVRARVKPLLEPMTGKVLELGDDPTRGASFKLFGNMMLLVISGGLADVYKLGRSLGIDHVPIARCGCAAQRKRDDHCPCPHGDNPKKGDDCRGVRLQEGSGGVAQRTGRNGSAARKLG